MQDLFRHLRIHTRKKKMKDENICYIHKIAMKKHVEDKAEKDYMGQQRKYDIESKKKSEKIDWRKKGPEVAADIAKVMTAYLLAKKMKREKRK